MLSLKEIVAKGQMVHFMYFTDGELWYITDTGFKFPVPIFDTSTATFNAEDRAILFMRWIRKHLELIEQARKEQTDAANAYNDALAYGRDE